MMMTQTQKKWSELPLLLILLWIVQGLEISLLNLPYYLGSPQIISILLAYFAFSRGWTSLTILSFVFAFMASANSGISTGVFVSSHVWTALIIKSISSALTLSGRNSFVGLSIAFSLILRTLTFVLLKSVGAGPTLPLFFLQVLTQTAVFAIISWLIYPLFNFWDHHFDHVQEEDHNRGIHAQVLR